MALLFQVVRIEFLFHMEVTRPSFEVVWIEFQFYLQLARRSFEVVRIEFLFRVVLHMVLSVQVLGVTVLRIELELALKQGLCPKAGGRRQALLQMVLRSRQAVLHGVEATPHGWAHPMAQLGYPSQVELPRCPRQELQDASVLPGKWIVLGPILPPETW